MTAQPYVGIPLDKLPHPSRLRAIAPMFMDELQSMVGPEWAILRELLRDDSLVLSEVLRRLTSTAQTPRLTQLLQLSTAMPGGTDQGGSLGMLAYLRHEEAPAPHFVIDDELVALLEKTDIAPDVPLSMFNLPYKRLYVEFGRTRQLTAQIPNALSGLHALEGAYVERGMHAEGEYLYVVLTGSPVGKQGPQDDATMSLALPANEPNRAIVDVLQSGHERAVRESQEMGLTVTPDEWRPYVRDAVLLLVKALLYIGLPGTRRSLHPERTIGLKSIANLKSPGKRAKALRRLDKAYDYIGIGPQPEHRLTEDARREVASGVGMRSHWRRGHYRMQAHGPQSTLRKLIFLQPTLVAAGHASVALPGEYRVS